MLKRYSTTPNGKKKLIAEIYTEKEHNINNRVIDREAISIIRRLRKEGYEAYIVGGAVRDLLIGNNPKDIDIVTNAVPNKIRNLFWNSRIIGKRFKLVHIHFKHKLYEVSTFRSNITGKTNNSFGTIEEDVKRRDFSLNALYYCPVSKQILDYASGMRDIRNKKIQSLIPLDISFIDDPVRIIRGIKYASTTGFSLPGNLKKSFIKYGKNLEECPSSRLTEELLKILESKRSHRIFQFFINLKLLGYFLPNIKKVLDTNKTRKKELLTSLDILDNRLSRGERIERGSIIAYLLRPFISNCEWEDFDLLFYDIFKECKNFLSPLTPPNVDIEVTTRDIITTLGIEVPQNRRLSIRKSKRKVRQHSAGPVYKKNPLHPKRRKRHQ